MNFAQFYREHSGHIKTVLGLFVFSVLAGAVAAFYYPDLMEQILSAFAERFGESPDLDYNLAKDIFLQNLLASAIAWLGGIFFGIIPFLVVAVNGFVLGYVVLYITRVSEQAGDSIAFILAGLLPHAVFELPAFFLAAVLGLNLGLDWLKKDAKGQRFLTLKNTFIGSLPYAGLVIALLVVAAIVEVFVSGQLVNNF